MHKHDHFHRLACTKGRSFNIPIYRWYCPSCKKPLSLLPDFLIPWARYTTLVREAAIARKIKGQSFGHIALTITKGAMSVSRCTIKRWWQRHLRQIAPVSLWLAKKLVQAGTDQDLLRLYPPGVNAAPQDTAQWFRKLLSFYTPKQSTLWGYWHWLNTHLPTAMLL